MIGTVAAIVGAWFATSIVVSPLIGHVLRRAAETTEPYRCPRRPEVIKARPLGRAELQRIADMFDPAALVVDEPLGGYTEVVFPRPDDAIAFVGIIRDGDYDAVRLAQSVETVLRVPDGGPVTLGVTLLPAWRPEEVAA